MIAVYPLALGVTLGTELLGAGLAGRLLHRGPARFLLACLLINLLVHPLFWISFGHLPGGYAARLLLGETLVVTAEAGLYRALLDLRWRAALGLSFALNLVSTLAGLLLWSAL